MNKKLKVGDVVIVKNLHNFTITQNDEDVMQGLLYSIGVIIEINYERRLSHQVRIDRIGVPMENGRSGWYFEASNLEKIGEL